MSGRVGTVSQCGYSQSVWVMSVSVRLLLVKYGRIQSSIHLSSPCTCGEAAVAAASGGREGAAARSRARPVRPLALDLDLVACQG